MKAPFHLLSDRPVKLSGFFQQDKSDDEELWGQILESFKSADEYEPSTSSIWATIQNKWHGAFLKALRDSDRSSLATISQNLHSEPLLKGIDQEAAAFKKYKYSKTERERYLLNIKSLLVRLAEAVGVLPVELSPRYREPENIYLDTEDLIAKVSERLDIDIIPPCIGHNRFGLSVGSDSVLTNRDLYAIYLAWRAKSIVCQSGIEIGDARLLEIGGGMGRLALYAYRLGFRNITLIDLPQISAVQAYFLSRALPCGLRLWPRSSDFEGFGVNIVSGPQFLDNVEYKVFDLAINTDSMPEMGMEITSRYIESIIKTGSLAFLSANQEARKIINDANDTHCVVSDVASRFDGLTQISRYPFWMRNGYVEELYAIRKNALRLTLQPPKVENA